MSNRAASPICDCHVHVVGPIDEFPQVQGRAYTASLATMEMLRAAASPVGVGRFVLVQPSFYGGDNSYLLRTLDGLGGHGRGVVVFESVGASPGQIRQYAKRGVRGVRVNLYSKFRMSGTGVLADVLSRCAAQFPDESWHVEIIAPLSVLISAEPAIAASTVPIVIDHYGLPGDVQPHSETGRRLLDLVELPHVWVKLSAPYRMGVDPLATAPPGAWLAALLRAAPDRCVWGSDWPHAPRRQDQTGQEAAVSYRPLDYCRVLGDFIAALGLPNIAERVLRTNPARLYGFTATQATK